jgi:hypothetical protein
VQTFYQPLFSHSFPFSNFPLVILFPSPKAQSEKPKSKPKVKAKGKKQKTSSYPLALQWTFHKQLQTGWSRGS